MYLFLERPKPEKTDYFLAYLPPEDKVENSTKIIWFKGKIQRISTKLDGAHGSPGLLVTFWDGTQECTYNKLQVMPILLFPGQHFEQQRGTNSPSKREEIWAEVITDV